MHPGSAGRQCGANPGMPPLRGCLHVGLYRIGPHPTIFVITTIVKTYIESPEPASNLADEQFLQRHSWIGRIPNPVHFRPRRRNRESQLPSFAPTGLGHILHANPALPRRATLFRASGAGASCYWLLLIGRSLLSKADEVARGVLNAQFFRSIERVVHSNRKIDALESGDDLFQIGNFDI